MSARPPEAGALWSIAAQGRTAGPVIADAEERWTVGAFSGDACLAPDASALIWSTRQLPAARALLACDGRARRLLLCPPDTDAVHLPALLAEAAVDIILTDEAPPGWAAGLRIVPIGSLRPGETGRETEWVLFTSGTTGRPKLVRHSRTSLTGPLAEGPVAVGGGTWSTFYDIRRYGGLQVLLRALLGGASLVLSQAEEATDAFLRRAAAAEVTHLLGTPTHWRRALMHAEAARLTLRYVRLSGEIADQAILDQLARTFPGAALVHAYASTEAGVGFEVADRREGFPASVFGTRADGSALRVVDGSLRLRSSRGASGYLGGEALADADGFIDTGDMVHQRDGRWYFAGRRSGVVNVGGQKVHPEEVEAVITRHPSVRMAQVRGRRSPVVGHLVVADLVLHDGAAFATVEAEVLAACRAALPAHKVPALLRAVPDLAVAASGKLGRPGG